MSQSRAKQPKVSRELCSLPQGSFMLPSVPATVVEKEGVEGRPAPRFCVKLALRHGGQSLIP